ncbi:MAG TPA: APC family permease [Egibacteraceae bacterium]|nr:APC family permease [Egibacteraceae bacterium]
MSEAMGAGEGNLRRDIGFLGLLALSVGINIGGGLFVLVNIAAAETGPSLPLAMALSAIPALLAIVPYRVLARAYPTAGASYRYMKLWSPRGAYMAAAALLLSIVIGGQPLFALMTGEYLARLSWVSWPAETLAVAVLVVFFVLNLLGVRLAMAVQSVLLFVLVGALVLFVAMGWGDVEAARFADPLPGGAMGLVTATVLLYALLAGGLFVVEVGAEVVDPGRVFGAVLPLGMLIVLALYVGITVVAVGAVPWQTMDGTTLVEVAQAFMSPGAVSVFILGGAVVAGVTTINGVFALVSRGMLVVAEEGLFPRSVGTVNRRFGTPHVALSVCFAGSLLSLLAGPDKTFLGVLMNLGLVVAIAAVCLAAARLPTRHPDLFAKGAGGLKPRTLRVVSTAVVAMNVVVALALASEAPLPALLLVLVAALAGAWHARVHRAALLPSA